MRALLTLLFLLFLAPVLAQVEISDSLVERLRLQRSLFPQEKVHIMTDRELYHPGDTVWMRAWVVEGETLKPRYRSSRFVYSDLRNGIDQAVSWCKLLEREGRFVGHMILPKELVSGDYTLTGYTYFILGTSQEFIFRKTIHVITDKDVAKGYVVRPLYEGYRPEALRLQPDSVRPYSYYRRDTLTRFTFDAPDSTWLSISVTDDCLTPVDTAAAITHMLPLVPDLFTLETVASDTVLYKPRFFYERAQSVSGRLTYRLYNKPYKVVLVNLTNPEIYITECDNDGRFLFRNLSYPDSTLFGIMAYAPNGKPIRELEVENFSLPKIIQHLPTDAKQYYFKLTSDTIAADSTSKSAKSAPDKEKEKLDQKVKEMLISSKPDDIYTRSAQKTKYTRTLSDYKYYDVREIILKFDDITFDGDVAKYKSNGMHVPVRFVLGTTEMHIEIDSLGKYLPQKALEVPIEMIYAVDFILPDVARTIGRTDYPDSPIIRIDLKNLDELVYEAGLHGNLKLQMPLGYVKRLMFPNIHISRSPRATRYWNPEYFTGPTGRVSLDLPLPLNYHTTYTLRAEGITPQGEPVSLIYRIIQ
jgi:hypothetical protein